MATKAKPAKAGAKSGGKAKPAAGSGKGKAAPKKAAGAKKPAAAEAGGQEAAGGAEKSDITVSVTPLGNGKKKVTIKAGGTVADALRTAQTQKGDGQIRVNDEPATLKTVLRDGDKVTIAPKVKGG